MTGPGETAPATAGGPVVVGILSHRDPDLLRRLVDRVLEGERTVALVHHDPRGVPHGLVPHDRLLLVDDPQPCDWGRMNLATAMLRLLETGAARVPDLEWLLLVSGQDYPAQHLRRTEQAPGRGRRRRACCGGSTSPTTRGRRAPLADRAAGTRYLHGFGSPATAARCPFPGRCTRSAAAPGCSSETCGPTCGRPAVHHVLEQRERLARVERYLSRCSVPDEALLPTLLLNDADHLRISGERQAVDPLGRGQPAPGAAPPGGRPRRRRVGRLLRPQGRRHSHGRGPRPPRHARGGGRPCASLTACASDSWASCWRP